LTCCNCYKLSKNQTKETRVTPSKQHPKATSPPTTKRAHLQQPLVHSIEVLDPAVAPEGLAAGDALGQGARLDLRAVVTPGQPVQPGVYLSVY